VFGRCQVCAEISRYDVERLAVNRRQHDQRLHLAGLIERIAGFRFDGSGAMPRKMVNGTASLEFQVFGSGGADSLHTRKNSPARLGDLVVIRAANAHLVIKEPGTAVNQVRVAVYEPRHDYAAGGVY